MRRREKRERSYNGACVRRHIPGRTMYVQYGTSTHGRQNIHSSDKRSKHVHLHVIFHSKTAHCVDVGVADTVNSGLVQEVAISNKIEKGITKSIQQRKQVHLQVHQLRSDLNQ